MNSIKSSPPSSDMIEAPSPAPIPQSVIHAETAEPLFITRCQYIKDFSNDSVKINIHKTDINEKFIKIIENTSDTWYNFHNHFQNDFTKFYELLNSSLKGECEHIRSNIHYLNGQIQLTLIHDGMFPFTIMIILEKEKEKIDILEDTINRILRENIYLNQQNKMILSKLNIKNINDYEFLEIQGTHLNDINYHSSLQNYSGEEMTSLENMKRRMLDNDFSNCTVYKNKIYYQKGGGWRGFLQSFDITSSKEIYDNAKTYVYIPKDDIQNIGPGVGKLSDYTGHINYPMDKCYYHGYIDTYNGPDDIPNKYNQRSRIPICTPHMFCVRNKFVKSDKSPDICEPCGEYSQIKFNDGETGRNVIPSKYYCTNCREVGSGDGYTVYECLGH